MTMFKALTALSVAATVLAAPAFATDRKTDKFVDQVRTEAAWQGYEVNRIRWNDTKVIVFGTDRDGNNVSFNARCRRGFIDCPTTPHYAEAARGESSSDGE